MEITPGFIEMQKAADILGERLGQSIVRKNISDTYKLLESLDWKAIEDEIHLQYNFYGVAREMGVGKYVSLSQVGNKGKRKRSKWASPVLYREVARLAKLAAKRAGVRAVDVTAQVSEGVITQDAHIHLNM